MSSEQVEKAYRTFQSVRCCTLNTSNSTLKIPCGFYNNGQINGDELGKFIEKKKDQETTSYAIMSTNTTSYMYLTIRY